MTTSTRPAFRTRDDLAAAVDHYIALAKAAEARQDMEAARKYRGLAAQDYRAWSRSWVTA